MTLVFVFHSLSALVSSQLEPISSQVEVNGLSPYVSYVDSDPSDIVSIESVAVVGSASLAQDDRLIDSVNKIIGNERH